MKYIVSVLFLLVVSFSIWANPEAEQFATQGVQALSQGQFEKAAEYYKQAYSLDEKMEEYQEKAILLKNVVRISAALPNQKDSRRWANMALSLRSFYVQNKLYQEVSTISKQIYEKFPNSAAAFMLGEGYILTEQYQPAIQFLSQLEKKSTPFTNVLLGISYAKTLQLDKAKEVAQNLPKENLFHPIFCIYGAVLENILGNQEGALRYLTIGLENILPSQSESLKQRILETAELQSLKNHPAFAKTMETQSQVKESSCSGGSSCGSCPSRGSCGSNNSTEHKQSSEKQGCTDEGCKKN